VANVRLGSAIRGETSDVRVRFDYLGQPFIVWEPFADNSRYWIGPADMVQGEPEIAVVPNTEPLREVFERYDPHPIRAMIGSVLTLSFLRTRE
jgi:hypothetical protein